MLNFILNYALNKKMQLNNFYKYFKSYFLDITSVKILDHNDNKKYVTFRFFMVRLLTFIINNFIKIRDLIDVNVKKVEFIKNYKNGSQSIIVCPKIFDKDKMTITDVVKLSKTLKPEVDITMGKSVFLQFELNCPNSGKINIKDYLLEYNDHDNNFSHTLENILIFNDHQISDDAIVSIKIYHNGKIKAKNVNFDKVKDYHISDFDKIDNI